MIAGIGTDMVDIRRIERILKQRGAQFIARCFAPEEQIFAPDHPRAAAHYAKRFAAKEAAAKAMGTGIDQGVYLKDIILTRQDHGCPLLHLQGRAVHSTPPGARFHVSLSDEPPYALAFVIMETP